MTEEYSYDYGNSTSDPYSYFDWGELTPTLIIYGTTFILGLTGNVLIIFTTFKYRKMKSVTNVFLSSLASADLLLIIVCIPVKVAKLFSYTWEMGAIVCKGIHYMQYVSAICSVLTLTAISIERYYAIIHPIKAKYICTISQAKRIIFLIWILSILLAGPTLEVQTHLPVGLNYQYRYCVKGWDDDKSAIWKFHEVYMLILILVGPFCIMTFSYTLICWEVWKVMERRYVMTSEQALSNNYTSVAINEKVAESLNSTDGRNAKLKKGTRDDTHMTKEVICMLVTVVVLFALCWTPFLIDNLLTAYGVIPYMKFGLLKYMSSAFSLLAYFNSCVNPIIYGFMSKTFRKGFLQALCLSSEARTPQRGSSYSLKHLSSRSTSIR